MNRERNQTFLFIMEIIIIIFFFILTSLVCTTLISKANNRVKQANNLQKNINDAKNVINILQSSNKPIEKLIDVKKEGEYYIYKDIKIKLYDDKYKRNGIIIIDDNNTITFVVGDKE